MSDTSPFPTFRWARLYHTYECSQCGKVVRWGQLAFVPDNDLDDDDDDDEQEGSGEIDPLAYRHPKYIVCSEDCLKSQESDHWEEAADERELWEQTQRRPTERQDHSKRRKQRRKTAASSSLAGRPLPVRSDSQTEKVARGHRTRRALDEATAEAFVTTFSDSVADICLRLEEALTVLAWADSQRHNHQAMCDCDRCTLAKRIRGECSVLQRAVRTFVPR
jgi:hypothetical protein